MNVATMWVTLAGIAKESMGEMDKAISDLTKGLADKRDEVIANQLSELVKRGLLVVKKMEPVLISHDDGGIIVKQMIGLELHNQEYVEGLEAQAKTDAKAIDVLTKSIGVQGEAIQTLREAVTLGDKGIKELAEALDQERGENYRLKEELSAKAHLNSLVSTKEARTAMAYQGLVFAKGKSDEELVALSAKCDRHERVIRDLELRIRRDEEVVAKARWRGPICGKCGHAMQETRDSDGYHHRCKSCKVDLKVVEYRE